MQDHAIPQDITGYKFHIVGNMTLKQFVEVAVGVVVGFFIFKTNLLPFIKFPLVLFSGGLGAALAFLPIEERPLDHWLTTFFTILYKPTKFFWKRNPKIPDAFLYKQQAAQKNKIDETDLTPQRRQRIKDFLQSVENQTAGTDPFDQAQRQYADQVLSIFTDQSLKITSYHHNEQKPDLKVQVRPLRAGKEPQPREIDLSAGEGVVFETSVVASETPLTQVAEESRVVIPESIAPTIEPVYQNAVQQSQVVTEYLPQEQAAVYQASADQNQNIVATSAAIQNQDLPFPIKPTIPNKLVGMILTPNGELINGATITVWNEQNVPVTAIKSNALGQFFISSHLKNGSYNIEVKKDGFVFEPVQIQLVGEIVEPLDIRSQS